MQESDRIIVSLLCDLVYPGLVNLDSEFAADEAWRRCGWATPLVTVFFARAPTGIIFRLYIPDSGYMLWTRHSAG